MMKSKSYFANCEGHQPLISFHGHNFGVFMELFALKQSGAWRQIEQVLLWRPHVVDNNTE